MEHEEPGDLQLGGEFEFEELGGFELDAESEQGQEQESTDQSTEQDLGMRCSSDRLLGAPTCSQPATPNVGAVSADRHVCMGSCIVRKK